MTLTIDQIKDLAEFAGLVVIGDVERQMTLDEYRKQSATFAALHQARN